VGTPLESRGCVRDDRTWPGIGPPVSQPTAFSLQPARGAHLLRVAGNVEFEQLRRAARRTSRGGRGGLAKPNLPRSSRATTASITRDR